jgi:hypothetical protein
VNAQGSPSAARRGRLNPGVSARFTHRSGLLVGVVIFFLHSGLVYDQRRLLHLVSALRVHLMTGTGQSQDVSIDIYCLHLAHWPALHCGRVPGEASPGLPREQPGGLSRELSSRQFPELSSGLLCQQSRGLSSGQSYQLPTGQSAQQSSELSSPQSRCLSS